MGYLRVLVKCVEPFITLGMLWYYRMTHKLTQQINEIREDMRVTYGHDGMPEDRLTIGQLEGIKSLYGNGHQRKAGLGYLYERFDS